MITGLVSEFVVESLEVVNVHNGDRVLSTQPLEMARHWTTSRQTCQLVDIRIPPSPLQYRPYQYGCAARSEHEKHDSRRDRLPENRLKVQAGQYEQQGDKERRAQDGALVLFLDEEERERNNRDHSGGYRQMYHWRERRE